MMIEVIKLKRIWWTEHLAGIQSSCRKSRREETTRKTSI